MQESKSSENKVGGMICKSSQISCVDCMWTRTIKHHAFCLKRFPPGVSLFQIGACSCCPQDWFLSLCGWKVETPLSCITELCLFGFMQNMQTVGGPNESVQNPYGFFALKGCLRVLPHRRPHRTQATWIFFGIRKSFRSNSGFLDVSFRRSFHTLAFIKTLQSFPGLGLYFHGINSLHRTFEINLKYRQASSLISLCVMLLWG